MSPRKAAVLAENLPPGSATWRSMDLPSAWSEEAQLLAEVVDATHAGNWQRGGGEGPRPEPVRRPHDSLIEAAKAERMAERAQRFKRREARRRARQGIVDYKREDGTVVQVSAAQAAAYARRKTTTS